MKDRAQRGLRSVLFPLTLSLFCVTLPASGGRALAAQRPEHVTGKAYEQALASPIGSIFNQKSLRDALTELAENKNVAVVIDRNVNPNQKITVSLPPRPLLTSLGVIAAKGKAEVTALKNVVYVGPPETARKLQTLVALRTEETKKFGKRKAELLRERLVAWPTLTRPAKLFRAVVEGCGLEVTGDADLPHDLWHAARLPQVDAPTALTIVLAQFGRSFEWTGKGAGIRVIPMPPGVSIERRVAIPKGVDVADVLARVEEAYPGVQAKKSGRGIRVSATTEVIGNIERIAAGEAPQGSGSRVPMAQRLFTLSGTAAAGSVLKTIQNGGNTVEWDAAAFQSAGIDLTKPITVKAKDATADELFKQICEALGIGFRVEELKVVLFAK